MSNFGSHRRVRFFGAFALSFMLVSGNLTGVFALSHGSPGGRKPSRARVARPVQHDSAVSVPLTPCGTGAFADASKETVAPAARESVEASNGKRYGELPLSFEVNRGQAAPGVNFLARGRGYNLHLAANGATLALHKPAARKGRGDRMTMKATVQETSRAGETTTVGMRLVGANEAARVSGEEELLGKVNYFVGSDPRKWRTGVPTFGRVRYAGVYAGVDVVYYGTNQRELEYDFIVAPGADYRVIRVAYRGVRSVRVERDGALALALPGGGVLRQQKPLVYQQVDGARREVAARYVVQGGREVGLEVGDYDRSRALIIDPVLTYSTYLGGGQSDGGEGIAVDSSGNAYVTGETRSSNFPTLNPIQMNVNDTGDVFVSKLNAAGNQLIYSTYVGGSSDDLGFGIALDSSGNAYVTGFTFSSNFPTVNPAQGASNGQNAFVFKLNAAGSQLVYSTYLGGSNFDTAFGIAVDGAGSAYVTGSTGSGDFPVVNPLLPNFNGGNSDGYVSKLNPAGNQLVYSTYLGGQGADIGFSIGVDAQGRAVAAGQTTSSNFPSNNAAQPGFGGNREGFVTKLSAAGNQTVFSTFLGGSGEDYAFGIAIDALGSAYVTGVTGSANFPVLNALQPTGAGFDDVFVTKLGATGTLLYSTFLGGSSFEGGSAIAVDCTGSAYVTGETRSTNFPTLNPVQATFGGSVFDVFVAKLNPAGNQLVYSTFLGGNDFDLGLSIAVAAPGQAYVTGKTLSPNFPTANALQPNNAGIFDAFVTRISDRSATNPIDETTFFVTQQYRDFLNREPDAAGLAFWTNNIESCGADAACRRAKREDTSAAFFLSIEFQQTGFLVHKTFQAAFARPNVPVTFAEFIRDLDIVRQGLIAGQPGFEQQLEANKQAYFNEFVLRPEFVARYPESTPGGTYVDTLYANAGIVPTQAERNAAFNAFGNGGAAGRARALRVVAENSNVSARQFNPAFVLIQYFGYLRRNPNDAPDHNFAGFNFWLDKLNQFGGDFRRAEMVKAFVNSCEYRARFGQI